MRHRRACASCPLRGAKGQQDRALSDHPQLRAWPAPTPTRTGGPVAAALGASLPRGTGHAVPKRPRRPWPACPPAGALAALVENLREEGGAASPSPEPECTDLGRKAGGLQGHDDGEFLGEEVTSEEDPRRREAPGAGWGGRELEAPGALGLHRPDSARGAIRREHLCQDVQRPQVCQGHRRRVRLRSRGPPPGGRAGPGRGGRWVRLHSRGA